MTTFASSLCPLGIIGSSFPEQAALTLTGAGTHTLTEYGNSILFSGANTTSGANNIVLYQVTPTVPYTLTVAVKLCGTPCDSGWSVAGLAFRDSAGGKIHALRVYSGSSGQIALSSSKFNSATSFSADYSSVQVHDGLCDWLHLRVADDNANRICSYSIDGYNYNTFHTIGRTDFLTANRVGFMMDFEGSATTSTGAALFANWRLT